MEFDEADDVVLFCGCDQSLVVIEDLHGRFGYQNMDASLDSIGCDVVVGI